MKFQMGPPAHMREYTIDAITGGTKRTDFLLDNEGEARALAWCILQDLINSEEGDMVYFIAGAWKKGSLTARPLDYKVPPDAMWTKEKRPQAVLAHGPDAFVAESAEMAKQKALIHWGVTEAELDSLEIYTLPFQGD